MAEIKIKNKGTPYKRLGLETEDVANPLNLLLIVSVFSTNRAMLSLGGLKPNFIKDEKRSFEEPPLLKRHM